MKLIKNIIKLLFLSLIIFVLLPQQVYAQGGQWLGFSGDLIWLRVNSYHAYISEQGAESETAGDNGINVRFSWPGEYGLAGATERANGIWLGCRDYYDSKVDKTFSYMVTNQGLKPGEYDIRPICDAVEFKMVGRFNHPSVYVDNASATLNSLYDILDEVDETVPADRMVIVKNHSSIGVTITKTIYVFTEPSQGNYFIYDYVLKNTGIINAQEDMNPQPVKDFYFGLLYRYAMGGASVTDEGSTAGTNWAPSDAGWGRNAMNDVLGEDPASGEPRAVLVWYGPHSQRPVDLEDDWGCPNQLGSGFLAAAKYAGSVVLHADTSPQDPTNDPTQPRTTHYIGTDTNPAQRAPSQYDEAFMTTRYNLMTQGHAPKSQAELVEESGLAANDWSAQNEANGVTSFQGFGPYALESGDSVHIVVAKCVAGLSREKNREVGSNWLQYFNGTGTPELIMPDGSETANHTEYKKAWVLTCRDSLLQTFANAIANYESGYNLPQPPPPPESFSVQSGGDRIRLSWAENADGAEGFDGYVIYRSEGSVMNQSTVYEKLWECNRDNVVHEFDDVTAVRGFDYYYYIQSKTDGSTSNGKPLYSSLFWTLTSLPANLQRPAVPKTPASPEADDSSWKLMSDQGVWVSGNDYNAFDAVSYDNSTYVCIVTFTGDTSATSPDLNRINWRLTTSKGEWASGAGYRPYDVVSYNGSNYVCMVTIPAGKGLELVRVVPNPYDMRARAVQFGEDFQYDRIVFYGLPAVCTLKIFTERGDLIWEKYHDDGSGDEIWNSQTRSGQIIVSGIYILYVEMPDGRSVIRKFVVIR